MNTNTRIEQLEKEKQKLETMATWQDRLKAICKKNSMTIVAFCKKHGLDRTYFAHQKSGRRGASDEYYERVETIFRGYEDKSEDKDKDKSE